MIMSYKVILHHNLIYMEQLKHECGVAMVRLLKPLEYYKHKYGTWMWGLNKLYLLMEKQHNRGQEGAGVACVKLNASSGEEYMFRERAIGTNAISEIFNKMIPVFFYYSTKCRKKLELLKLSNFAFPKHSFWRI